MHTDHLKIEPWQSNVAELGLPCRYAGYITYKSHTSINGIVTGIEATFEPLGSRKPPKVALEILILLYRCLIQFPFYREEMVCITAFFVAWEQEASFLA